jgi:Flp pilus assembly pilin Flp
MTQKIKSLIHRGRCDASGAAGIEYALIAGALAITIVASIQFTAVETQKPFERVAAGISTATP